jgi:hypothetical protein
MYCANADERHGYEISWFTVVFYILSRAFKKKLCSSWVGYFSHRNMEAKVGGSWQESLEKLKKLVESEIPDM